MKQVDRSRAERDKRRAEFNGLESLPFLSKEQADRLKWLTAECRKDNHAAMNEARGEGIRALGDP